MLEEHIKIQNKNENKKTTKLNILRAENSKYFNEFISVILQVRNGDDT